MKRLRFRDITDLAQGHTARKAPAGMRIHGFLARRLEMFPWFSALCCRLEPQQDSSAPNLGLTDFTPFLRNPALRPSTVLPLRSALLQTPKSVTKPVSPESLGTDVYKENDLDLRNRET